MLKKIAICLFSVFCWSAPVYAFDIADLATYESVAIKTMKKTDTKENKNRQIMGTQVIEKALGKNTVYYNTTYTYVGATINPQTGKTKWYYFCPKSWNGRCKGHINYTANPVMDAAVVGDLMVLGKKNNNELDIIIIKQGNENIPAIYNFMGVQKVEYSSERNTVKSTSFWARLFGNKDKLEPEQPVSDYDETDEPVEQIPLNAIDWTRIDLDVFKENKTGKRVFIGYATRITDGDTILLGDVIKIRMEGIDAPESKQTCKNAAGKEYDCGKRATEHLQNIIGNGKLQCEMSGWGKYGRYLMICKKMDGTDINAKMVRDGHAVVSTYKPIRYDVEEDAAIKDKCGIWAGHFVHPYCTRNKKTKKNKKIYTALCETNKYYKGYSATNLP